MKSWMDITIRATGRNIPKRILWFKLMGSGTGLIVRQKFQSVMVPKETIISRMALCKKMS